MMRFLVAFAASLVTLGCAGDKPDVEAPQLADPSKADSFGESIIPISPIAFGGEVRGDFTRDDQYDGYTFRADAGAVITLENTHLGTARRLDSTLFIYGPRDENGFYGAEHLAFDDDAGWGLHARIRDFVVPTPGEYMAVLGTYAGIDRGHYRLTLVCESESCEAPAVRHDANELAVAEDGSSQTFHVRLTQRPTAGVHVWVESDDHFEGVVFPTRILFCPEGTHENSNGCVEDRGDEILPEIPHWQRTVEVRLTGVRDDEVDGDATFSVGFRVESDDSRYADFSINPIRAVNTDMDVAPDYSELDDLTDDALLQALGDRIGDHRVFGYQGLNSARTLLFGTVDVREGMVESLYTGGLSIEAPGESIVAYMQGFNTEHSWPQGQFDRLDPMVSDLHHIYAVDIDSNGSRSSYGFGYNGAGSGMGSGLGPSTTDARTRVYQVRIERRGDIARAHFYMVARYAFDSSIEVVFDDDMDETNGRMDDDEEAVLRQWNAEDPVDDWERQRNERVHALQGNRNPFIDRPDLVDRVSNF